MNIFKAIPKKTAILALFLALTLLTLLFLLSARGRSTTTTTPPTTTQPTIPPATQIPVVQKIPSFRSSTLLPSSNTYRIAFDIPAGFLLPPTVENVEIQRGIDSSFVTHLKTRLQFSGNPKIFNSTHLWQTSDQSKTLTIDIESGYIQYKVDAEPEAPAAGSQKITEIEAEKIAEDFINTLNVVDIVPNTANTLMYSVGSGGDLEETTNPSRASLYEISYIQSYKGIPVYYHFATPATISVLVDIAGNIRSLQYFNIQPIRTVNTTLLDLERVKKRVAEGNYTIVQTDNAAATPPTTGTITVNSASLIYFDDKKNPTFFPTILLEGNLQPSNRDIKMYFSVLGD